ncbi:phosphatidylethanolamine N-methyltransferase /phosphatidyl-N-methylethanolamine N-methyltransferase [Halopolyspora algeriensis]|uniref:Phosphatidylethanolamine N-methyltransferase /phosphatidyl-N-methylethanolamine N-methyltransferase n=1 Tax=Halopolyspora algeriensis TaxID=1500506 RepID=A0A368W194_9ACTN|nr:class I SAM-dependent methyltransferase [Halopolyspora algeriensis]RCW45768.1 phosphatidylethanolamine N-methyltransferase /phosphatidyl-N-methylethanolamine N-methyltransferase [Halopolyspora algeriensis]TQM54152.1 phosphatidylethanolamine N-methyltransferase /phosphatidyl-N-methylethanolamine N-methyltransferase [Halopolyspora algeriensis]
MTEQDATTRARHHYDAYAPRYDSETSFYERAMLDDGRSWACSQARGETLEVAVGTGRNLGYYPPGVHLTGIDLSPGMLALARARADESELSVDLVEGDAQDLPFADAVFDTVLCTLGLSSIPDDRAAVAQMHRVLRPGGHLILLGHVASPHRPVRAAQHLLERLSARRGVQDFQTRRVTPLVRDTGFTIVYRRHFRLGAIQRLTALKPTEQHRVRPPSAGSS